MSAATPKLSTETSPAGPTFSYAQAAKGRSPSMPSPSQLSNDHPEPAYVSERRTSVPEAKTTVVDSLRLAKEGIASQACEDDSLKAMPDSNSTSSRAPEAIPKSIALSHQQSSVKLPQVTSSAPPSPSFGASSTSTLPKEDELSSSANGSSDSTWDKQSQGSQNGNKAIEKVEGDKEQSSVPAWNDESPHSVSLKEAPPPAINFWQHRKEIQEAKAKTKQSGHLQTLKQPSPGSGTAGFAAKNPDHNLEIKKQDNKKKSKASGMSSEDGSGSGAGKEGNKIIEGKTRGGEEVTDKGFRRGSRTPDADKPAPAIVAPLPPPRDAVSWPTPDSAQDEEKKKVHERAEKGERERPAVPKPHGRDKWMPVPYVPTAVFNTPLPPTRRGGRSARGGREGNGRGGSAAHGLNGTEKLGANLVGSPSSPAHTNSSERGRIDLSSNKNQSASSKMKRAASAGPSSIREQRKSTDPYMAERANETSVGPPRGSHVGGQSMNESRRASTATQTEDHKTRRSSTTTNQQQFPSAQTSTKASQNLVDREDGNQPISHDTHAHPKLATIDRRNEGLLKAADYAREFHGQTPSRERGEGRGDRARGGNFRNRGTGNHGFSSSSQNSGQSFPNSNAAQHQTSTQHHLPKSQLSHERHGSQSQSAPYGQSQTIPRSFRSNSRSQSIPHAVPYGRFSNGPNGPHPGPPHLSNLQTDLANTFGYQPGQQGIMSAMPYNAYMEQVSLFGMVSMQMEYYFSVDNLCKDMFLRKHMDSQGFVFLSVLAKFNRIKQLTQETELIRYVCLNSPNIEFRMGADGLDRLRKREGWQQWVLSKEERDPSAQNDGPSQAQPSRAINSQTFDLPSNVDDRQTSSLQSNVASRRPEEGQYPSPNGAPSTFVATNPITVMDGNPSDGPFMHTPLSAAVPDFAPAVPHSTNRAFSPSESGSLGTSSFTDEQVESLMIVVRKPANSSTPPHPPFPSASSRTFSNGSIDSRTTGDELTKFGERQSHSTANGDNGPEIGDMPKARRSLSPFPLGSPLRQATSNASPVFWVKDKETPIDSLPNDLTHESYKVFRRNALKQRERSGSGSCHRDMDILYQFWSHFLIRNFNTRMYAEFRQIAFEDAAKQESAVGIKNLIQYYDEAILGQRVISDDIARDFVELVKNEKSGTERPAFDKLRAAWRNGAFNMKNRKKIDNIINADLKAELER